MGKYIQALIVIAGFSAAIAAVKAEKSGPAVANCYEIGAAATPTVCK